jgi:hypothetical protein
MKKRRASCQILVALLLRPAVNPEAQRRKATKAPATTNEAATVGQAPDPTRKATAILLGRMSALTWFKSIYAAIVSDATPSSTSTLLYASSHNPPLRPCLRLNHCVKRCSNPFMYIKRILGKADRVAIFAFERYPHDSDKIHNSRA